jgi:hypothetical protein
MNQIIVLIFLTISNNIIVINACFIDNPYIKINKIYCDPNFRRQLRLTMNNIDNMEDFFLNNTETVDKFFNLLHHDSYTLLYIHIKNELSIKREKISNR